MHKQESKCGVTPEQTACSGLCLCSVDVAVIAPTTGQFSTVVSAHRVSGSVRCKDSGSTRRRARQTRAGNSTQLWTCECSGAHYDAFLKERGPT